MTRCFNLIGAVLICSAALGCAARPAAAWAERLDTDGPSRTLTVVIAMSAVPVGVTGHTGIAIEEAYWDFGPDRVPSKQRLQGLGSEAGPWWDDPEQRWGADRSLTEVLDDLPALVHPEGSVVLVFSAEITDAEARRVEDYWSRVYAEMRSGDARYALTHRQCASIGCHSLGGVAGLPGFMNVTRDPTDLPPQLRVMSPSALGVYLRLNLRHTAGPDAGQPARIERYQLRDGRLVAIDSPADTLLGLVDAALSPPRVGRSTRGVPRHRRAGTMCAP